MKDLQGINASQAPMFPTKSSWKVPRDLPNLAAAKYIGLDTESCDPDLKKKGPGVRRNGYTVGISVAVPEGQAWYLPFGHSIGDQLEKDKVMRWAKDNLCNPNQPKVGANILYDLDYLYHAGVKVSGPFHDIQVAEPLIDENARGCYDLDSQALKYLNEPKRVNLLAQACSDWGLTGSPQKHIWKLDAKYTGAYAEGDAIQALRIFEKQKVVLKEQGLERVFDIETRLIPMLLHMRQLGVKIDSKRLLQLYDHKTNELIGLEKELEHVAGQPINYNAAESIAIVFDKFGLSYPMTAKTRKPSFVKGWLETQTHSVAKMIVKCREANKFIGTFLEGSLLEMLVGDRIHCQFNQLRGDEFGAVTGRFSSSNPNLQFIPIRTPEGKKIRKLFIPDDGYNWYKADYSQIEIRVLAHYAMGKGAADIVKQFVEHPKTDYHQWCADKAGVTRSHAKVINFGIVYGMGAAKLAIDLGISLKDAKKFIKEYFQMLPFIPETVNAATNAAAERGYIKTILGRRRRFDLWEPNDSRLLKACGISKDRDTIDYRVRQYKNAKPNEGKTKLYRMGTKRAGCYKAFNAADQGSSADIMKMALVDVWESGVCDVIKPYITVHDELDFGAPKTKVGREAVKEVKRIMEETYELKVPAIVDVEEGPNWGAIKDFVE